VSKTSEVVVIGSAPIIIGQAGESILIVDELADPFRFIEEGERS